MLGKIIHFLFFSLFLIFSLFQYTRSLQFEFTNKNELMKQLPKVSLDQMVVIIYNLQKNFPYPEKTYTLFELYSLAPSSLLEILDIIIPEDIAQKKFNDNIIPFPSSYTVADIINIAEHEYLIKWVIHMEKVKIKKGIKTATIGGIVDIVNYMTSQKLYEILDKGISLIKSLNDRANFEKEIMNLRYKEDSTIFYLEELYPLLIDLITIR